MLQNRSRTVDFLLTLSAVAISAISLYVAIAANRVQEQLLAASTWPSLQFGTGNLNDQLEHEITLHIENSGVGPARIQWLSMRYQGEVVQNQSILFKRCCEVDGQKFDSTVITSSVDAVLRAEDSIHLLRLRKDQNPAELFEKLNRERFKIGVRACYCSVLDHCWLFDSGDQLAKTQSVDACPAVPENDRWQG
jgi:hypothetical protein